MKNDLWIGVLVLVVVSFILGVVITVEIKNTIVSNKPIKLSYTLNCADNKCDTIYKANSR